MGVILKLSNLFEFENVGAKINDNAQSKPKLNNSETYTSAIGMTQQFRFCPNPFRIDMYKGCDFGCKYCFANSSNVKGHDGWALAKFKQIESTFRKALGTDEVSKNVTIELLRARVPLHCGGMSDPFQKREFEYKLTYKLIELSNKYQYPISFSTKACDLPEEYFEILDPKLHAFQVSIMGWDDDYIKKYETNTPTASQRLDFVKKLRDKGFWCSIRIQPLVDIEQAKKLVEHAGAYPSYITVEHLKIPNDNIDIKRLFIDEYSKTNFYKSPMNFRNIEIYPTTKEENIDAIKQIANSNGVLIGVGDNDLHHLSQSRCCCGIDTIGGGFNNYLKYNLTYFVTGDSNPDELWVPKCNCKQCFYSSAVKCEEYRFVDYKNITNKYINDYNWLVYDTAYSNVMNKISTHHKNRLF